MNKGNPRIDHTRISKDVLLWHFRSTLYNAKSELNHLEFQLKYSKDMDGTPHTSCVEAVLANMREHLEAMEAFIREQGQ